MELLPLLMEGLTPDMVAKAEKELGETQDVKVNALKELKRLIETERNFHPLTDDAYLLRFLRYKKFDVKRAFLALKNFYQFKKAYSGIITDFTPTHIKKIVDMDIIFPIPKRLADGSSIGVFKPGHYDITTGPAEYFLGACLLYWEIGIMIEANQVCGAIGLIDLDNFSLNHFKHFASPRFLYRTVKLVQDCVPVRIKAIHLVNGLSAVNALFSIVKPFFSQKIQSRFHLHGRDLKSLHRFIPKEILPKELGGTLESVDHEGNRAIVMSYEDYFEKLKKCGYQDE